MIKLSILILTIPSRYAMFSNLKTELWSQMLYYAPEVQLKVHDSPAMTIGQKRNELLQSAEGEYICFIDDDDVISPNYVELLMKAVESGCDCASLKGQYLVNGVDAGVFEHSIKYKEWKTVEPFISDGITYQRNPNHLNLIKASIAKQFMFPETNFGEDHNWSKQIHLSGLLKTEYEIPGIIYYYRYVTDKNKQHV